MDALNVYGKTKDITVIGLGNSDLDDYARAGRDGAGPRDSRRPEPEKGGFYRSDHFPFAQQGVPALASGGGIDYVGKPDGLGPEDAATSTPTNDYHKPSDKVRPDWDMSGAVQDLQYYFLVGYRVAQADKFPRVEARDRVQGAPRRQVKPAKPTTRP